PAKPSNPPAEYDAEVRPNAIGGWEIGQPGEPLGVGNYPTSADAYSVACYNFEPARIRILQPRQKETAPAPHPHRPRSLATPRPTPRSPSASPRTTSTPSAVTSSGGPRPPT